MKLISSQLKQKTKQLKTKARTVNITKNYLMQKELKGDPAADFSDSVTTR